MYQSGLHFTSEYTILSGFIINIISNIKSMSISFNSIFMEKQLKVRSVHNTYT